eukprot:m.1310676 g.1310676  ORF g.1310676 m.1310676 type:complete len:1607 (-) comp24827_c0_seq2:31-4851(-)
MSTSLSSQEALQRMFTQEGQTSEERSFSDDVGDLDDHGEKIVSNGFFSLSRSLQESNFPAKRDRSLPCESCALAEEEAVVTEESIDAAAKSTAAILSSQVQFATNKLHHVGAQCIVGSKKQARSSLPATITPTPTFGADIDGGAAAAPVANDIRRLESQRKHRRMAARENLTTTAMNLGESNKVMKTLKAVLERNPTCTDLHCVSHQHLSKGDAIASSRFVRDDIVIIDYGRRWQNHTHMGVRVSLRLNDDDALHGNVKHTILMCERKEALLEQSTEKVKFEFERTRAYRLSYFWRGNKLLVYAPLPLTNDGDDDSEQSSPSSGHGNVEQDLMSFLELLITAIIKSKNRLMNRRGIADKHRAQNVLNLNLEVAANRTLGLEQRRKQLSNTVAKLKDRASEILFTDTNIVMILRHMRDIEGWDMMLDLLSDKDRVDAQLGNTIVHAPDISYLRALALYKRDRGTDRESAYEHIYKLCESSPNYMEAQGFKGKVFKALFSAAFRDPHADPEVVEQHRKHSLEAYTMLWKLECDAEKIPVWSASNLAIMLFAAEDVEAIKYDVWQYTDKINMMLSADLNLEGDASGHKSRSKGSSTTTGTSNNDAVWNAAALFMMNVIAAYLFNSTQHFKTANKVLGCLLTFASEKWMIQSLLSDLHLVHDIHKRRRANSGAALKEKLSEQEIEFNFWVQFLDDSCHNEDEVVLARKFPVLVSTAQFDSQDFASMSKMYVTIEARSISKSGSLRRAGVGSLTTFFPPSSGGAVRPQGSGGSEDDASPYLRRHSNCLEHIVQITQALPGNDRRRNIECPIKLVDLLQADIPKAGKVHEVDKRRIIMSSAILQQDVEDGGGVVRNYAETYTVMFASAEYRSQFLHVCKTHGYTEKVRVGDLKEKCPAFEYSMHEVKGVPQRVIKGEGTFSTVYVGTMCQQNSGDDYEEVTRVAIKELKESFLSVPHIMADFLGEINVLRQMKHENIVEFIGVHKDETFGLARTYLMELIDGSLSEMVDLCGPLLFTRTAVGSDSGRHMYCALSCYTAQIVAGVDYLHSNHNFCHRDLKPANFLVDATTGTIKLSDFGTVKDITGMAQAAFELVGSPAYFDPKVMLGKDYGLEVDIYCIGSTVWELTTGQYPYQEAENLVELEERRKHNPQQHLPIATTWPVPLQEFLRACFLPSEQRPSAKTLLGTYDFVVAGANCKAMWVDDELGGADVASIVADAMLQSKSVIVDGWKRALLDTDTDGSNALLVQSYAVEIGMLVEILANLVHVEKSDSTERLLAWEGLSNLMSGDNMSLQLQLNRARDILTILHHLLPPPDAVRGTSGRRPQVHFFFEVLRRAEAFQRKPHMLWEARDLFTSVIQLTINDIMPAVSVHRKCATGSLGGASSNTWTLARMTSLSMRRVDRPAVPLDLSVVERKLQEVIASIQSLNTAHGRSRVGHAASDEVTASESLVSYLTALKVPNVRVHATILAKNCITSKQLEAGMLSRKELMEIGLPLGVVCVLVPLQHSKPYEEVEGMGAVESDGESRPTATRRLRMEGSVMSSPNRRRNRKSSNYDSGVTMSTVEIHVDSFDGSDSSNEAVEEEIEELDEPIIVSSVNPENTSASSLASLVR